MSPVPAVELRTDRLVLRAWRCADAEPFAAMGADPEVMRHLGGTIDRRSSDALARRIADRLDGRGHGLWALQAPGVADFVGFTGLAPVEDPAMPPAPAVEIGWRLAREHWGQGYATEAAAAALRHGFVELGLAEIVSFTVPANRASWRVMERLGMHRDPADDFDHPRFGDGHPLRRHVLYRLRADEWRAGG